MNVSTPHATGFSVIELVIVIFISSLLWLGTYRMLGITRQVVSAIADTTSLDLALMRLKRQMVKDIESSFTPKATYQYYVKRQKAAEEQAAPAGEEAPELPGSGGKEETEEKPIEPPAIVNVWHFRAEEGSFELSFITMGGIQKLDNKGALLPQPLTKRVAFIGQPDPDLPGALIIRYRVSEDLALPQILSDSFSPSYLLIRGISQIMFTLRVVQVIEGAQPEEVKLDRWDEEEIFAQYKTVIPQEVTITGVITDDVSKRAFDFSFSVALPAYTSFPPPVREEAKVEDAVAQDDSASKSTADILKDIKQTLTGIWG